jgi:hypothetical protein
MNVRCNISFQIRREGSEERGFVVFVVKLREKSCDRDIDRGRSKVRSERTNLDQLIILGYLR